MEGSAILYSLLVPFFSVLVLGTLLAAVRHVDESQTVLLFAKLLGFASLATGVSLAVGFVLMSEFVIAALAVGASAILAGLAYFVVPRYLSALATISESQGDPELRSPGVRRVGLALIGISILWTVYTAFVRISGG